MPAKCDTKLSLKMPVYHQASIQVFADWFLLPSKERDQYGLEM